MHFSHSPYSSENLKVDNYQKDEPNQVVQGNHGPIACYKPPQTVEILGRGLNIRMNTCTVKAYKRPCTNHYGNAHLQHLEVKHRGSRFQNMADTCTSESEILLSSIKPSGKHYVPACVCVCVCVSVCVCD